MILDDFHQLGQQQLQRRAVVRNLHVSVDGVKKPQRSVRSVIEAVSLAFGEHIGDQSIAHVMGKRPQNPARLVPAAGHQRESFQTDHGVAAPVREPGVPRDNGPNLIA